MATKTGDKPAAASRTRYEDDLHTWVQEQVALLRAGRLTEIDALNVAEELSDVGISELRTLESAIAVLTMHLLKWDHQPEQRSLGWQATINEQRRRIARVIRRNPGLKPKVTEAIAEAYPDGRDRAVADTNLPYETYPEACPCTFEEMMTRPVAYEPPPKRRKR